MNAPDEVNDPLEKATRARLAKLASVPVDTSRLERQLKAVLARAGPQGPLRLPWPWRWRTVSGIAATIAVAAVIALVLLESGSLPVVAAPLELARVHDGVLSGQINTIQVSSFQEASMVIRQDWPEAPQIPEPLAGRVTSCCLHALQDRRVACILVEHLGRPVTLAVGYSRDLVCSADHQKIQRRGRTYLVHSEDRVQMAMIQIDRRWVCVMGDLPLEDLIELADGLRF